MMSRRRNRDDGRAAPGLVPAPRLQDLRALVEVETDLTTYPHAVEVSHNVPVYDGRQLLRAIDQVSSLGGDVAGARQALRAELASALADGPGIVVLQSAFDPDVVDRASAVFWELIAEQRARGTESGDHFAAPGANDRVWNALEKLAVAAPEVFVDYYTNEFVALVSEAWLGPAYQLTSQVNVVNPGGDAQSVHRDYHLGFLDDHKAARWPAHVHRLSPLLTLQGAVAHGDMPVETGPTRYLPHSQKFLSGYLAWRRPEFQEYFEARQVQLPLAKGDAVFFNPALFHAAGRNESADVRRMANLLQVSSAFGRAMESVDRARATAAIHPALQRRRRAGHPERALRNALAAAAEGYPFPTDLDRDPPVDGLAPRSQADLAWQALTEDWSPDRLGEELRAQAARRGGGR
jgi:ectoine hydroxylase-related dioxygenase (phytanoyl-CoA dioxygenase family)